MIYYKYINQYLKSVMDGFGQMQLFFLLFLIAIILHL